MIKRNAKAFHEKPIFFILFLVVLLLFGCGKFFEEKLTAHTSNKGRFSVSMPGKPVQQTQKISTGVGSIDMHMFIVEKSNIAYIVAYSDYPGEIIQHSDPDDLLDGAKNGAMQNIDGKITKEEQIAYGEAPAVELYFSAKGGKGKGQAVIVLSGNRLYQALAVGSNLLYPDKTVKKFIDSFAIW